VEQTCNPNEIKPRYYLGVDEFMRMGPQELEDKLAGNILTYGLRCPIIVDRDMNLISGGRRLTAVKRLGLKKIPIIIGDFKTVIAAMQAEQAYEDAEAAKANDMPGYQDASFHFPMTTIEKLKMVLVLRTLTRPLILEARTHAARLGGKSRQGKPKGPSNRSAPLEDAIGTVARLGSSSSYRVMRRLMVPVFGEAAADPLFSIRTPPNEKAALAAIAAYDNGLGAHSVWEVYMSESNPLPPQPMKMWEQTVGAIIQHIDNLNPLIEGLNTPPLELTSEQARTWGNDISAKLAPLRVLVSQLRRTNEETEGESK
jgi:hypothetical protein